MGVSSKYSTLLDIYHMDVTQFLKKSMVILTAD